MLTGAQTGSPILHRRAFSPATPLPSPPLRVSFLPHRDTEVKCSKDDSQSFQEDTSTQAPWQPIFLFLPEKAEIIQSLRKSIARTVYLIARVRRDLLIITLCPWAPEGPGSVGVMPFHGAPVRTDCCFLDCARHRCLATWGLGPPCLSHISAEAVLSHHPHAVRWASQPAE